MSSIERPDLAPPLSSSRSPTPGQRATMRSSGSLARCGSASQSASVTNGITGCSSRRYVSSTSTSVHQVASRTSSRQRVVGQPDLGELEAPVAVLVPDRLVDEPGHLTEGVAGHRFVDRLGRRRGAREQPALGRSEVARGRAAVARASAGIAGGRAPTTNRVAFQSLFAKLRACSSLRRRRTAGRCRASRRG